MDTVIYFSPPVFVASSSNGRSSFSSTHNLVHLASDGMEIELGWSFSLPITALLLSGNCESYCKWGYGFWMTPALGEILKIVPEARSINQSSRHTETQNL